MKTTGEKIRESRTHLGLTQTELADKIGVTLRTITKYEKQGVMPRGVNLQRLAEVLGVSTAYLSKRVLSLLVEMSLSRIRSFSSKQSLRRILLISSEPARSSPVKTTKSKQEYSECTDFWTTLVVLSGCIIENYFLK